MNKLKFNGRAESYLDSKDIIGEIMGKPQKIKRKFKRLSRETALRDSPEKQSTCPIIVWSWVQIPNISCVLKCELGSSTNWAWVTLQSTVPGAKRYSYHTTLRCVKALLKKGCYAWHVYCLASMWKNQSKH